jgi:hypothetical protein
MCRLRRTIFGSLYKGEEKGLVGFRVELRRVFKSVEMYLCNGRVLLLLVRLLYSISISSLVIAIGGGCVPVNSKAMSPHMQLPVVMFVER